MKKLHIIIAIAVVAAAVLANHWLSASQTAGLDQIGPKFNVSHEVERGSNAYAR